MRTALAFTHTKLTHKSSAITPLQLPEGLWGKGPVEKRAVCFFDEFERGRLGLFGLERPGKIVQLTRNAVVRAGSAGTRMPRKAKRTHPNLFPGE